MRRMPSPFPSLSPVPGARSARRRCHGFVALVGAALAAAMVAGAAPVGAASSDDIREQASALQDQIEASDLQISGLSEKLHVAEAKREEADAKVAAAEVKIQETRREIARIRELVRENGASLYRRTSTGNNVEEFDVDVEEINRRKQYAEVMAARDDRLLEQLATAKRELAREKKDASEARDAAAAEGEAIQATKGRVEKARADQQALLGEVQGELASALAEERAAREAAARARFTAQEAAGPVSYPNVGPPNGSASQAIAFARGVIGSPYSKNPRMGPSYDCSGLTYMAWKSAGVQIPTVSGTQYAGLPHVPLSAIQPGDLIFWGAGGSSHVALYVGGGMIIDASSSQGRVVERAIWGSPSGAARVT